MKFPSRDDDGCRLPLCFGDGFQSVAVHLSLTRVKWRTPYRTTNPRMDSDSSGELSVSGFNPLWNSKEEGRANSRFCFRPYLTAMSANDALDDGEPDPQPLVLLAGMKTLEGGEQLPGMGHVEAGSVVADKKDPAPAS